MTALCHHFLGAGPGPAPFREREIVDYYDGMTVGIVECLECGATSVLDMLDWDAQLERRIFRVAAIAPEIVHAYETKGGRATCKPDQALLEIEALLSQRGPTVALLAFEIHDKRVRRSADERAAGSRPECPGVPVSGRREIAPASRRGRWAVGPNQAVSG